MTKPYAVIMAGGSGTRFWPASRRARPKQLLALGSDEVLLREAVNRIEPLCGVDRIYIATGQHLVEPTLAALPELSRSQLLVEPAARNTAPCIGWAAATVARHDPEAVVMAMPADPHIGDEQAFVATLKVALEAAAGGRVATIGITPTHAETGYGYIEAADGEGPVRDVKRFVEKPDQDRADAFLANGNFYWNAGMFFFRATDMLAAIKEHLPDLAEGLSELDRAAADGRESEALATVFPKLASISIDHGVMEHLSGIAMVPGDFGWSDVGSWLAASELAHKDTHGNSVPAHTVLVDAEGNHVVDNRSKSEGKRVIALVGVRDLVVVETDDALLVLDRNQAQSVRDVVALLKKRGDADLT
jgi:mannose-1-phosphate guanylyltransferase